MLTINSIDYYNLIKEKLLDLELEIKFIQENDPIGEKQDIIINILKSSTSRNGDKISFTINRPSNQVGLLAQYNDKFSLFKKQFNVLSFFGKLATARNEIIQIFKKYDHEENNVILLLDNLTELAGLYQNIIQSNDDKKDVVIFFDAAEKYVLQYWSVVNGISEYIKTITNEPEHMEQINGKILELQLLDVKYDVGEFAEILQHLDVTYSTIAGLIPNISISSLQIIKIESGSLLSKILGDDNIIEAIAYMFKKIIDWVYHTYTKEGKIDLNSKFMQEISTDADILEKLENMGIDTKKSKENLSATLNVVTKELYDIAIKAPRIKIDDEEIKLMDAKKYLEYSTKYLNESTDDNSNENNV